MKRKEGKTPRVSRRLVAFLFLEGEDGVFAVLKANIPRVYRRLVVFVFLGENREG